ncbi:virion structural protein [Cellulophaga phage phi18:3]|uniref:Structural protein n=1 Tax=Cellulophaga phage phi18:3 TaxID=1327983 RepID=S0A1G9_9CAUD|nr:virion structural protein [Cellulophaga phage phi18:3]AGO48635.1 structural protein [Cellulophaga phage phi18:3]
MNPEKQEKNDLYDRYTKASELRDDQLYEIDNSLKTQERTDKFKNSFAAKLFGISGSSAFETGKSKEDLEKEAINRNKEEFFETLSKEELTDLQRQEYSKIEKLNTENKSRIWDNNKYDEQRNAIDQEMNAISQGIWSALEKGEQPNVQAYAKLDELKYQKDSLGAKMNLNISDYEKSQEDLQGFNEELDLFKTNWGLWESTKKSIGLQGTKGLLGVTKTATNLFPDALKPVAQTIDNKINETLDIVDEEQSGIRKSKSINDVKSYEDFGEFFVETLGEQSIPLVAAASGTGGIMYLGSSSFGGKQSELEREITKDGKKYSKSQILAASASSALFDTAGALVDRYAMMKGARALKAGIQQGGKKAIEKGISKFLKPIALELTEETVALLGGQIADYYGLDKKDVKIGSDLANTIAKTGITVGLMNTIPTVVGDAMGAYHTRQKKSRVKENLETISKMQEQLDSGSEFTDFEREAILSSIDKATKENFEIIKNTADVVNKLSDADREKIAEIDSKITESKKSIVDINESDKISVEAKEKLIEDFSEKIEADETIKEEILNKEPDAKTEENTAETEKPKVEETTPESQEKYEKVELDKYISEDEVQRNYIKIRDNDKEYNQLNQDLYNANGNDIEIKEINKKIRKRESQLKLENKNNIDKSGKKIVSREKWNSINPKINNETIPEETSATDESVRTRDNTNIQEETDNEVQPASEPAASEITTKRISPKGVKGEFDVEYGSNGQVSSIKSAKDGRDVPKFVNRKVKVSKQNPKGLKPVKNANYSRIEAEAIGSKTENAIRDENNAATNEAVSTFEPTTPYEAALKYMADGGRVKLNDAKSQGQGSRGGKWAAGFNKESDLPTIERASEIIAESSGLSDIDQQEIRDELESIVRENGSIDDVRQKIVELRNEKEVEAQQAELDAFKNSLSQEDFAVLESIEAEDDFLSELSDKEAIEYLEEQYGKQEGQQDVEIREAEAASVQELSGKKETESKSETKEEVDNEIQAQGITSKSKDNRDLALSKGGPVRQLNEFRAKFKRLWNQSFKSNAGATKEVANIIRSLGRETSAITTALEYEIGVLNKIGKDVLKKSKKDFKENIKSINEYMSGNKDADISFLNDEQINSLDALRTRVDTLSEQLNTRLADKITALEAKKKSYKSSSIAQTSIDNSIERIQNLIDTIEANKGVYLYRSYQAFKDKKYLNNLTSKNVNAEGRNRIKKAVDFIIEESEGKLDEKAAKRQLFEYLDDLKVKGDFATQATSGRADSPFLKKRKDIPEPIRELLGESKDPVANYVNTVFKISSYIASLEYQETMAAELLDSGLGTYEAQEGYTKLTSDSEGWQGLSGIYVSNELYNSIQDLQPLEAITDDVYKAFVMFSGFTKLGKTVLSPTTAARNFYSGVFLGINAGFMPGANPKLAAKALKLAWGTKKTRKELKAELYKLHQLGILGDGGMSQEVIETINDFSNEIDRMVSKNVFTKSFDVVKKIYALGDDYYKVIGFYTYKQRYMSSGMTEMQSEAKAAERMTSTFPTYSMLPKNVQRLRRVPFVGTFVSFPYEVLRTTANTLRFIKEDIDSGRNKMAMQQAAGLFVASASLGVIGMITRNMIGFDDEDDDTLRNMLPDWQKNAKLIYTGKDKHGQPTFMDGTALFPAEVWLKPLRALLEDRAGRSFNDKMKISADELFTPYIGLDISYKTVNELISNKDQYSKKIYEGESLGTGVFSDPEKIVQHYLKNAGPGVYANITEFMRANDINPDFFGDKFTSYGREYNNRDAIMGLLGFRFSTINYASGMSSVGFDLKEKYNDVRTNISRKLKSTNELDEEQIGKLIEKYNDVNKKVSDQVLLNIKGARKLGVSDTDIENALNQSGFSIGDIDYFLTGDKPPLKEISKTTEANQVDKIDLNYKDKNKANKIIDSYYKNVDLFNTLIYEYPDKEKTNPK